MHLATRMENSYAQRIEDLLTPLVGQGRVRAQVDVDLDFSQTEKASESYDGDKPALRSEQTSSEQKHEDAAGAIAGALSNEPPNTVAQPTAAKPNAGTPPNATAPAAATRNTTAQTSTPADTSSSSTRNYELGRTISHVSDPAGRMVRLTVAVVVDNLAAPGGKGKSVPLSAQELQRLTDLTKNAVGFDAQRGDSVSVINQAFSDTPVDDTPITESFWQHPGMLDLIKQGAGILIALLIAFGLLKPMLKGLLRGPEPMTALAGPIPTVSVRIDDDGRGNDREDQVRITSPQIQSMAYEQKIGLARKLVQENPKQVAQVVMNWVGDDGG
jgi:flagellar M-ring protein FliF